MRSMRLESDDGLPLRVYESSEVGGPACLLIHGSGDGAYIWNDSSRSLIDLCRLVSLDLRGHGDSGWSPDRDYRTPRHVADVEHVVRALDLRRLIVIGHSLGGEIACHLAASIGDRLVGMLIIDFGPDLNAEAKERARLNMEQSMRTWSSMQEYQQWLLESRPLLTHSVAMSIAEGSLRRADGGFELKADPALTDEDPEDPEDALRLWRALAQIHCPVLIMRGAGSAVLTNQVAERMRRTLPRGRLQVIERAGHAVMIDNPRSFAEHARAWVARLLAEEKAQSGAPGAAARAV